MPLSRKRTRTMQGLFATKIREAREASPWVVDDDLEAAQEAAMLELSNELANTEAAVVIPTPTGSRVRTLCWPNQIELRLVESGQHPINRLTDLGNELVLAVRCECVCVRPGSAGLDAGPDV